MAEIRKVAPSNPISSFRQVAPTGGGMFAQIATLAEEAYDWLAPAAAKGMEQLAAEEWREIARQNMGQNRAISLATTAGPGSAPSAPTEPPVAASASPIPVTTRSLDNPDDPRNIAADTADVLRETAPAPTDGASAVTQGLIARGLPPHVAEAFAWNAGDESRFNPGINEEAPIVPGSRGGYGLFQWTGPRRRELEAFAASQGKPVDDFEMQLDFLVSELQGSEANAANLIMAAEDTPSAAAAIVNNFLRPAESHRASREARYMAGNQGAPTGRGASRETMSASGRPGYPSETVMVRTSTGSLERRLYSPLAGPILQAYNAAAMAAYGAETLNAATVEIFELSNQFKLDPQGFNEAATEYVDQLVEAAPEQFQAPLREQLTRSAQQRYMGMVEEQQSDVRQRAQNSNTALMGRYQDELTAAIAAGDEEAIGIASANLDDALRMRETLPGLAWTPEQSENVRIAAARGAAAEIERRQKDANDEVKGQLDTIIEARKNGMTSAYESILTDPAVAALFPELVREAAGWVAFGEALPSFDSGTEEERAAAIAELQDMPVVGEFQIEMLNAARERNDTINEAWDKSPIDAASEFMPPEMKPPELAQPGDENYVSSLAQRAAYAKGLVAAGYSDEAVIFSEDEAKALTAALSASSPAEVRLVLAASLVSGLGDMADKGFGQLANADPVTIYGGKMLARGGNPDVALEALTGQILLKENQVQLPEKADRVSAFDADISAAIAMAARGAKIDPGLVQTEIMTFAQSIYAARAAGIDPNSDAATELMKEAVQTALGQGVDTRGRTVGGVQKVGGHSVLLPPTVSGDQLTGALRNTVQRGAGSSAADVVIGAMRRTPLFGPAVEAAEVATGGVGGWTMLSEPWTRATSVDGQEPSMPYVAGEPMPANAILNDEVRFVPIQGNLYRMEVVRPGAILPVEGADGKTLLVDVTQLIRAAR